jgi:hypothetical protein
MSDTDRSTMANNVATALTALVDRQIMPVHAAMNDLGTSPM